MGQFQSYDPTSLATIGEIELINFDEDELRNAFPPGRPDAPHRLAQARGGRAGGLPVQTWPVLRPHDWPDAQLGIKIAFTDSVPDTGSGGARHPAN